MSDISTVTSPNIAPVRVGNIGDIYRQFPSSQPFTYRDSVTFQGMLERIRAWIEDTLIPYLRDDLPTIEDAWREQVSTLIEAVDKALADEQAAVGSALTAQSEANAEAIEAALADIRNHAVQLNDTVVLGIVNKTDSQTRGRLDDLYGDVTVSDADLKTVLSTNGSTATTWLDQHNDGRYNPRFSKKVDKTPNAKNAITGWFHVVDYGALTNDGNDDNDYIQAAIIDANTEYARTGVQQRVYFDPGNYNIGVRNFTQPSTGAVEACGVYLKDGVELYGMNGAALIVNAGAYGQGAYFAIVRSIYEGLNNAGIRGLAFNGSKGNQVDTNANSGNILLEARYNVWVEDCISVESNGNSIMVRGNAYGDMARDIRIRNNKVYDTKGVGIQASQFDGLKISGNTVRGTTDNGIDIYGEYSDHGVNPHGINFQVNDNDVRNAGLVGIFFETVAYGVAVGNRISNSKWGMRVNRINGQPTSINIRANGMFGCETGIAFSGDMSKVSFIGNEVQGAMFACVAFDGLRCSGVFGTDNILKGAQTQIPMILVTSYVSQLSQCYWVDNLTDDSGTPNFVNYAQATANCSFGASHGPGF